ncbi:MAG: DUF429 domain-containing protein [Chloroflexi bacterium]|nr:DUF429 domain-containing protein [Chloroflexota bacterium]
MRFIGIDLAWSERNESSIVAIEEGRMAAVVPRAGRNSEIVSAVVAMAGSGPAWVAVDAPLIVPNQTGTRPCDRLITQKFGRFQAGTYPANRQRRGGAVRGERIAKALAKYGFVQTLNLARGEKSRRIFEVYPHPAMISIFRLERTLKYKRGDYTRRYEGLRQLQKYLGRLQVATPAIDLGMDLIDRPIEGLRGRALKTYEDTLDAAFCAYIAYYCWYWGPEGYEVYGDLEFGYIIVPMTSWMRAQSGEL